MGFQPRWSPDGSFLLSGNVAQVGSLHMVDEASRILLQISRLLNSLNH